ncbi:MAG: beta-N-acetylglucosaminidase domain-containing protein, partial [Spongiibacteraceae bacterium]
MLGLIEGFYGRQWTWPQRQALPAKLAQWGYDSYIYAPKGDRSLRSHWQQPFSAQHLQQLSALGAACAEQDVKWGLGLSPAGLQGEYGEQERDALQAKLVELASLSLDYLWVLFDDLPAGNPSLAANQIAVVNCVRESLPAVRLAMCPSYYSFDPILEELFGECPEGYFAELAAGLADDVDILWTGNRVISALYTEKDMLRATQLLGRKPLLWDNYPVNDGRLGSRFINLAGFQGRAPALRDWSAGHMVNPMNQYQLSCLVLPSLPEAYCLGTDYVPELALQNQLAALP